MENLTTTLEAMFRLGLTLLGVHTMHNKIESMFCRAYPYLWSYYTYARQVGQLILIQAVPRSGWNKNSPSFQSDFLKPNIKFRLTSCNTETAEDIETHQASTCPNSTKKSVILE